MKQVYVTTWIAEAMSGHTDVQIPCRAFLCVAKGDIIKVYTRDILDRNSYPFVGWYQVTATVKAMEALKDESILHDLRKRFEGYDWIWCKFISKGDKPDFVVPGDDVDALDYNELPKPTPDELADDGVYTVQQAGKMKAKRIG